MSRNPSRSGRPSRQLTRYFPIESVRINQAKPANRFSRRQETHGLIDRFESPCPANHSGAIAPERSLNAGRDADEQTNHLLAHVPKSDARADSHSSILRARWRDYVNSHVSVARAIANGCRLSIHHIHGAAETSEEVA